jgi:mercuric ion binding protein
MKNLFKISALVIISFFTLGINNSFSQTTDKKASTQKVAKTTTTSTFKVYGNCHMCKQTIESSLKKKDGIYKKDWNMDTQMMTVTYDPAKTSLKKIQQKIADVGYDNEYARAKDEVYNNLRGCCKYERPKQ